MLNIMMINLSLMNRIVYRFSQVKAKVKLKIQPCKRMGLIIGILSWLLWDRFNGRAIQ